MGGIAGFFKSIKKKITLKGAIKAVATVGGVIPVVGAALQGIAGVAAGATKQAEIAQVAAQEKVEQALGTGTYTPAQPAPGSPPLIQSAGLQLDTKTVLIAGGALVLVFLLARRR